MSDCFESDINGSLQSVRRLLVSDFMYILDKIISKKRHQKENTALFFLTARNVPQFVNKGLTLASYILFFVLFYHLEVGMGKVYRYMDICVSIC